MKKVILWFIVLVLSCTICSKEGMAQTIEGSRIKIKEIIVDSLNKPQNELNEMVQNWFGTAFKNASKVITSKTSSSIQGRYINSFYFGGTAEVSFYHDIKVDIKDNKIRIQSWISDGITSPISAVGYFYNKKGKLRGLYKKGLEKLIKEGENIIGSLEKNIKSTASNSDNDW